MINNLQFCKARHINPLGSQAGSEINFFGYSPVGRVAIKLYSPDTKIYSPNVNSKQQDKQALATIINDRT